MEVENKGKSGLKSEESKYSSCKTDILILFILLMVLLAVWNKANSSLLDYATFQYIKDMDGLAILIPRLNVPINIYVGLFNTIQLCICCLLIFGMLFRKVMNPYVVRSRKTMLCFRIYALITVLNLIYMIFSVAIVFKIA